MNKMRSLDDIQCWYAEFLENKSFPKLERLNNWGKHRCFFKLYFNAHEIMNIERVLEFDMNNRRIVLNANQAPDFMNSELFIGWLSKQLEHS